MSKGQSKLEELGQALEEADIDIQELVGAAEQYQDNQVSRRDLLGAGAGVAGAAALGGFASGKASADPKSTQTGTFGNGDEDWDVQDITGNHADLTSLKAKQIGNTHAYASAFGTGGAAIQSALDEHGTDPSVVHVDTEVSSLSTAPLTIPSNTLVVVEEDVTLAGSTQENIFQNKNHFDDATDDTNIIVRGDGGVLDGNKSNNTERSSDGTGYGIGSKQNCVSFIGVKNVRVEGLTATNAVLHGITIMGADEYTVANNQLSGNRYAGVNCHWRETDSRRNFDGVVSENVIIDGGQNAGESAGVYLSGCQDHVVDSNVVDTRENMGISVASKVAICTNITVSNNTIRDVSASTTFDPAAGIRFWTSGASLGGVSCTGNVVETTSATNNEQFGIAADTSGSETIFSFGITGNTIRTQAICISLRGGGGYIEDFSIANNTLSNTTFGFAKGIEARDVKEGQISDNVVAECQGSGIHVESNTKTSAKIGVYGNMSYANGQAGNSGDTFGIRLLGPDDVTIISNRCWDVGGNQTYGIQSDTGTSDTVALINDLRGNSTGGHDLAGSGTITDAVGQGTAEDWNVT